MDLPLKMFSLLLSPKETVNTDSLQPAFLDSGLDRTRPPTIARNCQRGLVNVGEHLVIWEIIYGSISTTF